MVYWFTFIFLCEWDYTYLGPGGFSKEEFFYELMICLSFDKVGKQIYNLLLLTTIIWPQPDTHQDALSVSLLNCTVGENNMKKSLSVKIKTQSSLVIHYHEQNRLDFWNIILVCGGLKRFTWWEIKTVKVTTCSYTPFFPGLSSFLHFNSSTSSISQAVQSNMERGLHSSSSLLFLAHMTLLQCRYLHGLWSSKINFLQHGLSTSLFHLEISTCSIVRSSINCSMFNM